MMNILRKLGRWKHLKSKDIPRGFCCIDYMKHGLFGTSAGSRGLMQQTTELIEGPCGSDCHAKCQSLGGQYWAAGFAGVTPQYDTILWYIFIPRKGFLAFKNPTGSG